MQLSQKYLPTEIIFSFSLFWHVSKNISPKLLKQCSVKIITTANHLLALRHFMGSLLNQKYFEGKYSICCLHRQRQLKQILRYFNFLEPSTKECLPRKRIFWYIFKIILKFIWYFYWSEHQFTVENDSEFYFYKKGF